jgi:hypothetical protein
MNEQELKTYQLLLNNRPIEDFEDYSPNEMNYIIYDLFNDNSVISFHENPSSEILSQIPFLSQVKFLLTLINKQGELKLTTKGFLPIKSVSEIYNKGFIKDDMIESGINKLYKESDCDIITLTRIIPELAGLIKKRSGKLSLTKNGKKIIDNNNEFELLKTIFSTFIEKFNWSFFDYFEDERLGQLGVGFTFILLNKYGNIYRTNDFYTKKYLKAFPWLKKNVETSYSTIVDEINHCYSVRTFERFLNYFNLIEIKGKRNLIEKIEIKKTDIFDKIIKIE